MSHPLLLRSLVLTLVCVLSPAALAGEKKETRRSKASQVKKPTRAQKKTKRAKKARKLNPKRLTQVPGGETLRSDAADAFHRMIAAAREEGVFLWASSGYRDVTEQRRLYQRYQRGKGPRAARPGRSNHHLGIAVDIPVGGSEKTVNYDWLAANACRFGFRRTVPREPWHWEYRPYLTSAPEEGFDCLGRPLAPPQPEEPTATGETASGAPPLTPSPATSPYKDA